MRFLPKARHAQKLGVPLFQCGGMVCWGGGCIALTAVGIFEFSPASKYFSRDPPPPFLTPFVRLLHSTSEINVPTQIVNLTVEK